MEKNNYRLIPFDIKRAKTPSNPDGLEVVAGGKDVRIICTDRRSSKYIIVALIYNRIIDDEDIYSYDEFGVGVNNCLLLKEPIMPRRMTNQELACWLRDCPEEHREWKYDYGTNVYCTYNYLERHADDECENILIRRNGGEWREPLVDAN
jgi:hypothetical protein